MRHALTFLLLGLLLTGCVSHDANLSWHISGTWSRAGGDLPVKSDGGFLSWTLTDPGSLIISPDGSFSASWGVGKDMAVYHGKWRVKSGMLILTSPNGGSTSKIILLDEHQFVYEGTSGEVVKMQR
jgi:hypothetical protein